VVGLQKLEVPPKSVKQTKLKSIFFIYTEMGEVWVALETSFLLSTTFHPTNPHMQARP